MDSDEKQVLPHHSCEPTWAAAADAGDTLQQSLSEAASEASAEEG
jgi:hypothetical protein